MVGDTPLARARRELQEAQELARIERDKMLYRSTAPAAMRLDRAITAILQATEPGKERR